MFTVDHSQLANDDFSPLAHHSLKKDKNDEASSRHLIAKFFPKLVLLPKNFKVTWRLVVALLLFSGT